jgi:hypothetical protein
VTAARLLRIELRRNAMPWILPLIAALFWFDSYRPSTTQSAFWVLRTFWNMGQGHTIIDFGPFVAGVAAWMGSRDGRRGMGDLVAGTPRSRWAAQLATWGATAIWAAAAYLAFVGVMFAVYARQGLAGSPPWWWVAVGATAVTAFSAAGFAGGVFFPSRFAAALAAFGGFLAMVLSSQTGFGHTSGWALILPTNSNGNFQPDSGILYPYLTCRSPGLSFSPASRSRPSPCWACRPGRAARGCGGPPPWSPSPGPLRPGRLSGWPERPGSGRTAWSSPRCTTRPATS